MGNCSEALKSKDFTPAETDYEDDDDDDEDDDDDGTSKKKRALKSSKKKKPLDLETTNHTFVSGQGFSNVLAFFCGIIDKAHTGICVSSTQRLVLNK